MLRRVPVLAALLSLYFFASATPAQEGFPLDGTWRAALGAAAGDTERARQAVLILRWDGERINGVLNPGPRAVTLERAVLEPSDWSVTIEARPPDADPILIEGVLMDIGAYDRFIEGTWTQGGDRRPVRITRE